MRRDNLDDYWWQAYGHKHSVLIISGLYENAPEHVYQHRELALNEKLMNLVFQLDPKPFRDKLVACLWGHWTKLKNPVSIRLPPSPMSQQLR